MKFDEAYEEWQSEEPHPQSEEFSQWLKDKPKRSDFQERNLDED